MKSSKASGESREDSKDGIKYSIYNRKWKDQTITGLGSNLSDPFKFPTEVADEIDSSMLPSECTTWETPAGQRRDNVETMKES